MSSRDLWFVAAVILGVLALVPVLGMSMWGMMGPGMMGRWGYGMGGGFGPLTFLLLIVGVVLFVLAFTRKEPHGTEPLEILKARLAKGEITKEQFEDLRRALQ